MFRILSESEKFQSGFRCYRCYNILKRSEFEDTWPYCRKCKTILADNPPLETAEEPKNEAR